MRRIFLTLFFLPIGLFTGIPSSHAQDWPADAPWARFAAFSAPAIRACVAHFVGGPAHIIGIQALGSARFRIGLVDARQGTIFVCVAGAQTGIITSGGPQGQAPLPFRQTNLLIGGGGETTLSEPACWRPRPVQDVNGSPLGLLLERLPCGPDGRPVRSAN